MAWSSTTPMDQKTKFIADHLRGTFSISELCTTYGISRKTGYKWIDRYLHDGPGGLEDQSRKPYAAPNRTSLYTASPQPMPDKLPPIEYPDHFEVRYVGANGGIRWNCAWVNVSTTCAGEYVGLEEIDDGVWNVYFGRLKLGRLLERQMRIEDAYGRLSGDIGYRWWCRFKSVTYLPDCSFIPGLICLASDESLTGFNAAYASAKQMADMGISPRTRPMMKPAIRRKSL
jgi:transposase-like protein